MYSFWCILCIYVLSVCAWARLEICIPDIGALHFGIERISPKNEKRGRNKWWNYPIWLSPSDQLFSSFSTTPAQYFIAIFIAQGRIDHIFLRRAGERVKVI